MAPLAAQEAADACAERDRLVELKRRRTGRVELNGLTSSSWGESCATGAKWRHVRVKRGSSSLLLLNGFTRVKFTVVTALAVGAMVLRLHRRNEREGGLAKDARNAGGNLEEGEMRHALSPESV